MYNVITEISKEKNIEGTFLTFSEAKTYLNKSFNNKMWAGSICSWSSSISYYGMMHGEKIKTYIKKI